MTFTFEKMATIGDLLSLPISVIENVAMKMLLLLPQEQVEDQDAIDSNSSATLTAHTDPEVLEGLIWRDLYGGTYKENKDFAIWPEENRDSVIDNNNDNNEINRNSNEIDRNNISLTSSSSSNTLRYKTEMCKNFAANNYCDYGDSCQFAHGKEVRKSIYFHRPFL